MNNVLSVTVTNRKTSEGEFYEGTVSIEGLKPTKLARKSDGSTMFPTRSAVSGAARNLAKSLGFADVSVSDAGKTSTMAKKPSSKSTLSAKTKTVVAAAKKQTIASSK